MPTLTISYTGTTPVPASGYRIRYWDILNPNSISTVITTANPFITTNGILADRVYEGIIQSSCSSLTYSIPINFKTCVPIGTIEFDLLPSGKVSLPYYVSMNLTGTAPFTLSNIIVPAWMSVNIVGSTVVLSGNPTTIVSNTPVQFVVHNCTSGAMAYTGTVTITAAMTFTAFTESGYSTIGFSQACTDSILNMRTLYTDSTIPFGVGSIIYSDNIGTVLTGQSFIKIGGDEMYEINPTTGVLLTLSLLHCS